jgi:DNA-binding CsgD family transcriptional regulator
VQSVRGSSLLNVISDAALPGGLTETEFKVAAIAARGISLRQVAEEMGWTYGSLKVYLTSKVYRKLGIHSQAELVRWWVDRVENRGNCDTCILSTCHRGGAPESQ